MSHESRVAVFVDAENVAQWIKLGGVDTLLEDLSSIGPVVVRKAYARWTNENMLAHQATLNRHGFELIHTFHPASGKNSADIQIAVDVMEYASRDDLRMYHPGHRRFRFQPSVPTPERNRETGHRRWAPVRAERVREELLLAVLLYSDGTRVASPR